MLRFVPVIVLALILAEIAVFVVIGSRIGALAVVLWVVAAAIAGAALIRRQGVKALARLRATLDGRWEETGSTPVQGLLVVLAGLLLMLPGFLSDAAALFLLLPFVRRSLGQRLSQRFAFAAQPGRPAPGRVIEGEAVEIADPPANHPPRERLSPWNR